MKRLLAIGAVLGLGCAPTAKVQVEAPQPIVIQLDIKHEVRLRIEGDVEQLVDREAAAAAVRTRGGEPTDIARVSEGRDSGAVRETADGYVAAIVDDPALAAAADRTNASRKTEYEALAAQHGVARSDVEAIAASVRTR